jgi:hypothetical protein
MPEPHIFRALGEMERIMGEFRQDLFPLFGWQNVRLTTSAWTSPGQAMDQSQFCISIDTKNEVGYELQWTIDIMVSGGRYTISRSLYGSGRADTYRNGQQMLFEMADVEVGSLTELCACAPQLTREFRAALTQSLKHVPND